MPTTSVRLPISRLNRSRGFLDLSFTRCPGATRKSHGASYIASTEVTHALSAPCQRPKFESHPIRALRAMSNDVGWRCEPSSAVVCPADRVVAAGGGPARCGGPDPDHAWPDRERLDLRRSGLPDRVRRGRLVRVLPAVHGPRGLRHDDRRRRHAVRAGLRESRNVGDRRPRRSVADRAGA